MTYDAHDLTLDSGAKAFLLIPNSLTEQDRERLKALIDMVYNCQPSGQTRIRNLIDLKHDASQDDDDPCGYYG